MLNPFCQVPTKFKFELGEFCVTLCCAGVTVSLLLSIPTLDGWKFCRRWIHSDNDNTFDERFCWHSGGRVHSTFNYFNTHICFRLGCSWTGVHPSPTARPRASGNIFQPRTKKIYWRGFSHSAWTSFGGRPFCSSIGWFLEGRIRCPSPVVAHPISWGSWKGWEGAAKMGINPCRRERGNRETEGVGHPWWTCAQRHATTSRRKLAKCWSAYEQQRPHFWHISICPPWVGIGSCKLKYRQG